MSETFVGNIYIDVKASAWMAYDEGKNEVIIMNMYLLFEGMSDPWRGGAWQLV